MTKISVNEVTFFQCKNQFKHHLKQKKSQVKLEIFFVLKKKNNYLAPHSFKEALFIFT